MKTIAITALLFAFAPLPACGTASGAAQEFEPYPFDTCLVMDSQLGSMGDPISKVYAGREVKFCCRPCVEEFENDQAVYLKKLDEALDRRAQAGRD